MMKNILVLSCGLFFLEINATIITIQLGKLGQEELHYLAQIAHENAFKKLVITVIPGASFSCEYKEQHTFLDSLKDGYQKSTGFFSIKTLMIYGFKTVFGTGVISYITIFYFIYRVYKIVKKLQTVITWIAPDKKVDSTDEALLLIEKMVRKKEHSFLSKQDYYSLQLYRKLTIFLYKLKIRSLFPIDKKADETIDQLLNYAEKMR